MGFPKTVGVPRSVGVATDEHWVVVPAIPFGPAIADSVPRGVTVEGKGKTSLVDGILCCYFTKSTPPSLSSSTTIAGKVKSDEWAVFSEFFSETIALPTEADSMPK